MKNRLLRTVILLGLLGIWAGCGQGGHRHGEAIPIPESAFEKTVQGKPVSLYTLRNERGMLVQITNYGARVVALWAPGADSVHRDVVWGYETIDDYLAAGDRFSGPIVGRYGNRIGGARFELDGREYRLTVNDGANHLHGGSSGFADKVWDALSDPEKFVVVQPAPAVRVALGEEFGLPIGTRVTGKMTQALRRLGFDKVFDTDFGADLTIMEEATELLGRIQNGGVLPMFTSCSPGWVKYLEHHFPEMIPNMSTCKSPMEMEGAIIKTYYAEKTGIDPANIVVVAVMPCTSKKFEAQRPEMVVNGMRAVDVSLTTRELARMIRDARIDFARLPDEECFDELVAQSTGAAPIFGVTGGVMEAALRTAADVLENRSVENVEYHEVRGLAGIKEATFTLGGKELKVAVASSTGAAKELIQRIKAGDASYAFVEVMACPGGCVNGGGQPIVSAYKRMDLDPREKRAAGLYAEDESKVIRKSHENPDIKKLYEEFLGKPNSHLAHRLLHTEYTDRS